MRFDRGIAVPHIDNWPAVPEHLEKYYQAFYKLAGRRHSGMGIEPLQYDQLLDFLRVQGVTDPELISDYAYYVMKLDDAYVTFMADKSVSRGKRQRERMATEGRQQPKPVRKDVIDAAFDFIDDDEPVIERIDSDNDQPSD